MMLRSSYNGASAPGRASEAFLTHPLGTEYCSDSLGFYQPPPIGHWPRAAPAACLLCRAFGRPWGRSRGQGGCWWMQEKGQHAQGLPALDADVLGKQRRAINRTSKPGTCLGLGARVGGKWTEQDNGEGRMGPRWAPSRRLRNILCFFLVRGELERERRSRCGIGTWAGWEEREGSGNDAEK